MIRTCDVTIPCDQQSLNKSSSGTYSINFHST